MSESEIHKLILENMSLVPFVLKKYINVPIDMYEDLLQEGYLTLTKVARSFDESKGKFSTYAVVSILGAMRLYIRDNNQIRLPRDFYKNGNTLTLSSIDEELDDSGFKLLDVLEDESALDDLKVAILEDTIIKEAKSILIKYNPVLADACLEDLYSKMWSEPVTQQYLADKYGSSQPTIGRALRRFYKELECKIM